MMVDGDPGSVGQQIRLEIAQPAILTETVTGDCFDAAEFSVGVRVMDCPIEQIIDAGQHTAGAGQAGIA